MKNLASLVTICILSVFITAMGGSSTGAEELPLLHGVKRILFLGDSITYAGAYVDYVQAYLETHSPEQTYDIIDIGLPSETVSGLSEPGHADGAFPRPVLSERLDRVFEKVKPDLVFACYGMNDGIYYPFSEDRFAKYRSGIQALVDKAKASGARLVLLTPPPFDPTPIKGQTLPAGLSAYPHPFEGYDTVLARYSEWLVSQRKRAWNVIDIHTPINKYMKIERRAHADFALSVDGVHLDQLGHWLIADQILNYLGAGDDTIVAYARNGRVVRGDAEVQTHPDYVMVKVSLPLPVVLDPSIHLPAEEQAALTERYNGVRLKVKQWRADRVHVTIGDTDLGILSTDAVSSGISLAAAGDRAGSERTREVLSKTHEMRAMLTDAWLHLVGHKRPGMPEGIPLEAAIIDAAESARYIKKLAAPISLEVTLRPSN